RRRPACPCGCGSPAPPPAAVREAAAARCGPGPAFLAGACSYSRKASLGKSGFPPPNPGNRKSPTKRAYPDVVGFFLSVLGAFLVRRRVGGLRYPRVLRRTQRRVGVHPPRRCPRGLDGAGRTEWGGEDHSAARPSPGFGGAVGGSRADVGFPRLAVAGGKRRLGAGPPRPRPAVGPDPPGAGRAAGAVRSRTVLERLRRGAAPVPHRTGPDRPVGERAVGRAPARVVRGRLWAVPATGRPVVAPGTPRAGAGRAVAAGEAVRRVRVTGCSAAVGDLTAAARVGRRVLPASVGVAGVALRSAAQWFPEGKAVRGMPVDSPRRRAVPARRLRGRATVDRCARSRP